MDTLATIPERHELLGFFAHPGTLQDYLLLASQSIAAKEKRTVLYHNLHSLYSYFTSAELRKHYENTTVLVDGMPLIWLMKLCRLPVNRDHRLTYVDFIMPLMQLAEQQQWTVFHVGQHHSVQEVALNRIRSANPDIDIKGHDGYFDLTPQGNESLAVVDAINSANTQLLLIGFGAPKQEAWLAAHRHLINAPIVFTCGACMEYVAGHVKTPPRWMGRLGLEWSFRLLENPRRFAFRYFVEPVILLAILLRNGLGLQRSNKQR
ncbi:MAG: WecB/TagA/CpsF family glycosyltransferase [Granulosicoccus sp.]